MADLTKTTGVINTASADATSNAGAASQTVVVSDKRDGDQMIRIANADSNTATITIATNGYGGGDAEDVTFTVAENEVKYLTLLESMYFKAGSTGAITLTITDADGTAFSGTVADVTLEVITKPDTVNT